MRINSKKMRINKNISILIIVVGVITGITLPITIILPYTHFLVSPDVKYSKGFQVTYDDVPQSDPIVILNPKGTNIFYRYRQNILLNYRTTPGVIVKDYIIDGEPPQLIPPDNYIPTPEIGSHTLMLTGTNSTGDPCNSTTVSFYIGDNIPGVLGAAPECYDYTYRSTVHFAKSPYGLGLITDTEFEHEIFLEGPEKPITVPIYTKNIDLSYEGIVMYVPFIVLRSEPWYNHTVEVKNSHWINLVSGGKIVDRLWVTVGTLHSAKNGITNIIYFKVSILHVFGNVTYWNDETRKYDVFNIEGIDYLNSYQVSYGTNDSIIEYPNLGPVDLSLFSGMYHDKNMIENEFWEWKGYENWLQSYGIEASVFLGNYAGVNSCPVPVRFSLPQYNIINNELIPDEIIHKFTKTDYEPENFDANYRGLENVFSMNIIPI